MDRLKAAECFGDFLKLERVLKMLSVSCASQFVGDLSRMIIHPGKTIAEVLEDRGITQAELSSRTGVSPAYVSNVIAGKKGISANFAMGLEYALERV